MIPFYNPKISIWDICQYLLSKDNVSDLNKIFCGYIGCSDVILTNSGKDALKTCLLYYGISTGDEVILPSFTCPSVAMAILELNAVPVFADIIENGFNISLESVKEAITKKTKAIIVAYMAGIPVDLDGFLKLSAEYGVVLIEDCAQAFGAKYKDKYLGLHGDAAIYSFGISKNIGGVGGGALVLNKKNDNGMDIKLMENRSNFKEYILAILSTFVFRPCIYSAFLPILKKQKKIDILNMINNPRENRIKAISNIAAYFAKRKLLEYETLKEKKNANAMIYRTYFSDVFGIIDIPHEAEPAYPYYPVLLNEKQVAEKLCKKLLFNNIEVKIKANVHFMALWRYPFFREYQHYGENVLDIEDRYVLFPLMYSRRMTESICNTTIKLEKIIENERNDKFIKNL